MGPEIDTRFSPFTYLTLKGKNDLSKFEPGKIAARKDMKGLCETIEKELMKRGNETKI